nr:hypothetical protein [Streptomyces sp. DSM 41633]
MEPLFDESTFHSGTDQNRDRGALSRRMMLGGMTAAGVGAAAVPLVAGCDDANNASGGGNGSPPDYGTGINDGFNGRIELDVRDSKPDWTPFELK